MVAYTVIVADHSHAALYALPTPSAPLRRLRELANPAGHRHERDLGSGAPGRVMGWNGVRHAFTARHTLQQHATENFIRQVIAAVPAPAPGFRSVEVLLVAAPALRGLFRRLAPRSWHVTDMPLGLAKVPPAALRARVQAFVRASYANPPHVWFGAA